MMIPTRKMGGFIIPQRTMTEMFFSAANGMMSLLSEKTRVSFIDSLEKGVIQEGVLSQATAGTAMMLSLFHDLQNPLFKRHNFDPSEFVQGLVPALENFHNVSSALENELHEIYQQALLDTGPDEIDDKTKQKFQSTHEQADEHGAVTEEEKESLLSALRIMTKNDEFDSKHEKVAEAILNHEWMNEAKNNPDSLAAQLSRMVTKELFQINQLSSKTAFLLQNQSKDITYREGSCRVNNVALLGARACLFKEKEGLVSGDDNEKAPLEYEAIDEHFENDAEESGNAVAAQLEVLYDVTQEFAIKKPSLSDKLSDDASTTKYSNPASSGNNETTQTTIVSVATIEGWLHGGPDGGKLRWKLASYRPPYEFPEIEHAYKY